jgi:outer membrane protein assembly factor BamB
VFVSRWDPDGTTGALLAIDLKSGVERWRYRSPSGRSLAVPVVEDQGGSARIWVAGLDGDVVQLDASDGGVKWRTPLGASSRVGPVKASDTLYVATADSRVVALDAATGSAKWAVPTGGSPTAPLVVGGRIIVGTREGELLALANDGSSPGSASQPPSSTPAPRPSSAATQAVGERLVAAWSLPEREFGVAPYAGLAVAHDGRLWISDPAGRRFFVVGANGDREETWVPRADLDLIQPDGDGWAPIAFLPDGRRVIADTDNQRILVLEPGGRVVDEFGSFGRGDGEFVSPFGVTVGPDRHIYVVDDPTCRVQTFTPEGVHVRTVGGSPEHIDRCTNQFLVDRQGTVYLPVGDAIAVLRADGTEAPRLGTGQLREPVLLAFDQRGEILAANGFTRIDRISRNGALLASWRGPGLEQIAAGLDGEVYAVSTREHIIRRYDLPELQDP